MLLISLIVLWRRLPSIIFLLLLVLIILVILTQELFHQMLPVIQFLKILLCLSTTYIMETHSCSWNKLYQNGLNRKGQLSKLIVLGLALGLIALVLLPISIELGQTWNQQFQWQWVLACLAFQISWLMLVVPKETLMS